MNSKLLSLLLASFLMLGLSSCKDDNDKKMTDAERLVGTWTYITTQEKVDGQWKDLPNHTNVQGEQTYYPGGKATITMYVDGVKRTAEFQWTLQADNQYYTNGNYVGKLIFESNDRFSTYSNQTVDPETDQLIPGEYRDLYQRKP